jgi:pyrimidine-nucleoside phosphorylase
MVSSILSKKIASGTDAVVFDIKCGTGAFMKHVKDARDLAALLAKVAGMLGVKTGTVLTRMDEPLGYYVGNALEVREAIEVLKGRWVADLVEVSLALGAEMLMLARKARGRTEAYRLLKSALLGGKALQKFKELVKAQGGDVGVVDDPERLPRAPHITDFKAARKGYIRRIDALEIGHIATKLGSGRATADLPIDPAVGIEFLKRSGDAVGRHDVIARIHASGPADAASVSPLLEDAITIGRSGPKARRAVIGRVTPSGIRPMPVL